jgi:hypothetical protein
MACQRKEQKLNGEKIANNVVSFADAVKGKIANGVASIRSSVASFAAAA